MKTMIENKKKLISKFRSIANLVNSLNVNIYDGETYRLCSTIKDSMVNIYKRKREVPSLPNSNPLYKHLSQCLSHFTASKSKKYKYDILYTFPTEETIVEEELDGNFNENQDDLLLNKSDDWVKNVIIPYWGKLSKSIRTSKENFDLRSAARFLLLGDPGAGKTIFVNYLLSSCHEELHSANLVYVRIDLTKGFYDDMEIIDCVYLQTAKILREFYSTDLGLNTEDFRAYIYNKFSSSSGITLALEEINSLINEFNFLSDKRLTPLDRAFCEYLLEYVSSVIGKDFLFILDGLDLLGLSHVKKEEFKRHCIETINFFYSEKNTPGVYVICMREFSYEYIVSNHNNTDRLRSSRRLILLPAKLKNILKNRISLASKREQNKLLIKQFPFLTHEHYEIIINSLLEFMAKGIITDCELCDKGQIDEDAICELLENQIFNRNYRKILESLKDILQYIFVHYENSGRDVFSEVVFDYAFRKTTSSLNSKSYIVLEQLLLGKKKYFQLPLLYDIMQNDEKTILDFSHKEFEGGYIPNVFNFIDDHDNSRQELRPLLKVRVLQLVKKSPRHQRRVANLISDLFKYNKEIINYEIEEMLYSNLIKPKYGETGNKQNYMLQITPLGNFILNNFIYNKSYLNQISNNTPLPLEYQKYLKFPYQFSIKYKKSDWLVEYFNNVMFFLQYIKRAEEQEILSFNNFAQVNKKSFMFDNNPYGFSRVYEKMTQNTCDTMTTIISSVFQDSAFRDSFEKWFAIDL